MNFSSRNVFLTCAMAVCHWFAAAVATAQTAGDYPNEPISLVVPFSPGSGTDAVARLVASQLSQRLGQPVVVDNKAGASAQIGAAHVAKAKPDGYTLFMTTNTSHSANPHMFKTLRYDPIRDFTPIARVGELPFALIVNPSVPTNTVQALIEHVRANPNKLAYGTPNSTSLVAAETLKYMTQTQMISVPYKSSPQALTDLVGNQIQIYVADLGSSWGTLKTDRVRTLGVTSAKGSSLLPDVPAIGQALPGFDLTSWNGIFGPAGLPREIVDRLNTALQDILRDPAVQQQLGQIGFEVWPTSTPAEFAVYVQEQLNLWGMLIRQAGITPQ